MANNSAGARSVLCSRPSTTSWSRPWSSPTAASPSSAKRPQCGAEPGPSLEALCIPRCCAWHRNTHPKSTAVSRKGSLRRVGATTSTNSQTTSKPVNLAKLLVEFRGTLGVILEAKVGGSAAEGQGRDGDLLRGPSGIARGRADHPEAQPLGHRGDGQIHPRLHPSKRESEQHSKRLH